MTLLALALALLAPPQPPHAPPDAPSGALTSPDDDVALVVAIEDYYTLPDVPGAASTGYDWARWFEERRRIPLERVTLVEGDWATRARVLKAVAAAAETASARGTLWLVFVGHGATDAQGRALGDVRAAVRDFEVPTETMDFVGFRPVRTAP